MGAKTLITPEEYLALHFSDREPEYVRGELQHKPMPDRFHGAIQVALGRLLWAICARHQLQVVSETRCRVRRDIYRLPDIALFPTEPFEPVPSQPPIMVAEIVSRDEKRRELVEKLRDYAFWGVPHIWIVDPWTKQLAVWRDDTEVPVDALTHPEYEFEVRLDELIAGLPLD